MNQRDKWLLCDKDDLLKDCRVDAYKSPGPGGQRKNKVETAIRLVHKPSGLSAQGQATRSQRQNKSLALRNLQMHIACGLRTPADPEQLEIPAEISECLQPIGNSASGSAAKMRLTVSTGNRLFWAAAAFVLDVFEASGGKLADAARAIGVSTSNLASFLRRHRALLAAAQQIRKANGHSPLK